MVAMGYRDDRPLHGAGSPHSNTPTGLIHRPEPADGSGLANVARQEPTSTQPLARRTTWPERQFSHNSDHVHVVQLWPRVAAYPTWTAAGG